MAMKRSGLINKIGKSDKIKCSTEREVKEREELDKGPKSIVPCTS